MANIILPRVFLSALFKFWSNFCFVLNAFRCFHIKFNVESFIVIEKSQFFRNTLGETLSSSIVRHNHRNIWSNVCVQFISGYWQRFSTLRCVDINDIWIYWINSILRWDEYLCDRNDLNDTSRVKSKGILTASDSEKTAIKYSMAIINKSEMISRICDD